jgi:hypothetical protein
MTEDPDTSLLRPYLLTSGRAQPVDQSLEIEAQVMTSRQGTAGRPKLTFERQEIVALCRTAMSVAEVAADLGLHIGVARVLVADLAEQGHVVVRRPEHPTSPDLGMIERVIRGLEAIQ